MANRRIEMFQYRHVIHRMRMGDSDRSIAKSGLIGRSKCGHPSEWSPSKRVGWPRSRCLMTNCWPRSSKPTGRPIPPTFR